MASSRRANGRDSASCSESLPGFALLKQLALLCAAGQFVSLLMLTYGLDLSPGFF
jgi:hypothetical protein